MTCAARFLKVSLHDLEDSRIKDAQRLKDLGSRNTFLAGGAHESGNGRQQLFVRDTLS
jgi:hypothetical protein